MLKCSHKTNFRSLKYMIFFLSKILHKLISYYKTPLNLRFYFIFFSRLIMYIFALLIMTNSKANLNSNQREVYNIRKRFIPISCIKHQLYTIIIIIFAHMRILDDSRGADDLITIRHL